VIINLAAVAAGIMLLARASDTFVVGAADLARRVGVPPLIVGAVVIGFGTSAPELLASSLAAAGGNADVGVGNIIGSNLANLTLVLGAATMVRPLTIASRALRREAPVTLGAMALFAWLARGGVTLIEGLVLGAGFGGLLVATVVSSLRSRHNPTAEEDPLSAEVGEYLEEAEQRTLAWELVRTGGGLIGTLVGAQLLVWGAVELADRVGLSGGFVGLTLVAVGTSLPEITTAIQAARRNEHDLLVGNLLGSNLFNSLAVGAAIGLIAPGVPVDPDVVGLGVVLMMAGSVGALALMRTGFVLTRLEAAALLVFYGVSVALLA
jgi:cation:H+ antiporter